MTPAGGRNVDVREGLLLNPTAEAVWDLLPRAPSLEELTAELSARFDEEPATLHADVSELLGLLCRSGLVRREGAKGGRGETGKGPRSVASVGMEPVLSRILAEGRNVVFTAFGSSMHPAIPHGATLEVAPAIKGAFRLGDVLVTRRDPMLLLVHRLVSRSRGGAEMWVQTWGDARPHPDSPVPASQVLGIVRAVSAEGRDLTPDALGLSTRVRILGRNALRILRRRVRQASWACPDACAP